jgi:hypothetical protein
MGNMHTPAKFLCVCLMTDYPSGPPPHHTLLSLCTEMEGNTDSSVLLLALASVAIGQSTENQYM